jgi:hypothetical protein
MPKKRKKLDAETQKVLDKNQSMFEFVNLPEWQSVRQILCDKILDLQNAFNIEDGDAERMMIDLKGRKIAAGVLYEFLREIEGGAQTAAEDKMAASKLSSYVVSME